MILRFLPLVLAAWTEAAPFQEQGPARVATLERASLLASQADYEGALAETERYLEAHPGDPVGLFLRARISLAQGHGRDAERDLLACVAFDDEQVEFHLALGLLYQRLGDLDRALQALVRAAELEPADGFVANTLGVVHALRGEVGAAQACFHDAERLLVDSDAAELNLAQLDLRCARPSDALTRLSRLRDEQPGDPRVQLAWIRALAASGCHGVVEHEVEDLLRTTSGEDLEIRVRALEELGLLHELGGDLEGAIGCLEAAIMESDQASPLYGDLGQLYAEVGRYEQAESMLRLGLLVDDRTSTRLELARVLCLSAELRPEDAARLHQEALEHLRDLERGGVRNPRLLGLLARLEEESGDTARAESAFAALLALVERHPALRGDPDLLLAVAERSFHSQLDTVASPTRGRACLQRLARVVERLNQRQRRRLLQGFLELPLAAEGGGDSPLQAPPTGG